MEKNNAIGALLSGLSSVMAEQGLKINNQAQPEWWHFPSITGTVVFDRDKLFDYAQSALFGLALQGGPTAYVSGWNSTSYLHRSDQLIKLIDRFLETELSARLVYAYKEYSLLRFYVFHGGALEFKQQGDACILRMVGTSKAFMQLFEDLQKKIVEFGTEQSKE